MIKESGQDRLSDVGKLTIISSPDCFAKDAGIFKEY